MFYLGLVFVLICLKFVMAKKPKLKIDQDTSVEDPGWCNWSKSSSSILSDVEKKILSSLRTPYNGRYVEIGSVVGESDKIWTISLNEGSTKTPLVLLHGLGAGVALWVLNLDELAADRPVYAIDILGFGRSSRPEFSSKGKIIEMQMVTFVEEWCREMKLDKFILLGHSLGGYISSLYKMQYPERVKHLILADPWGLPKSPENVLEHYKLPFWVRGLAYVLKPLNPLWALRVAGPWGESLMRKSRGRLVAKYSDFLPQADIVIPRYIHQCNSQKPSGESAFHSLMHFWAFAKNPIINRVHRFPKDTRITMIFGAKSWVDSKVGLSFRECMPEFLIDVHIIPESGHHVYLDQPELFNKLVLDVCSCEDMI